MNRFDEVARLITIVPPTGIIQIAYTKDLIDAAPWLLGAAACFQPGDADLLHWMRTAEGNAGDGTLEEVHDAIESLLIRMEKAAEIMEE